MYQASPPLSSQLVGLGTAGMGAAQMYKAFGAAKGGAIKTGPSGLSALAISNIG
jgi:hypothetical protein